jgi:hypothetical protein
MKQKSTSLGLTSDTRMRPGTFYVPVPHLKDKPEKHKPSKYAGAKTIQKKGKK